MDAKQTLGEPRALISREALLHNVKVIRRTLSAGTKLCAIVKADAYGHGADIIVDTLCNFRTNQTEAPAVDALAVASIDEAAELPECALPVLIFRPVENVYQGRQRERLEQAIGRGWVLTVCSASAAEDVSRVAMSMQRRASVQLMIDTGMTRSGTDLPGVGDMVQTIAAHPSLRLWGLCTHFACSEDRTSAFTAGQLSRFRESIDPLWSSGEFRGKPPVRHAANSGAIFLCPDSHLDMVRPGLSLYGIDPTCRPSLDRALRPVMKWTAPLLLIKDVKKGAGVGYGQTWHAERDTRIGLVPIGYADGYLRSFSNCGKMLVHGRPVPVVGRVSMDLTTIDLHDVPMAAVGDEVTVLDDDPLSPASVYELARWGQTIPYEIFCRIAPRVHRVAVEPAGQARPITPSSASRD